MPWDNEVQWGRRAFRLSSLLRVDVEVGSFGESITGNPISVFSQSAPSCLQWLLLVLPPSEAVHA